MKFNFLKPKNKIYIDIEPSAPPYYEYFLLKKWNQIKAIVWEVVILAGH